MLARYLENEFSHSPLAVICVKFSPLTRVVLMGLLEVIKVDPATVNVKFVVNDSGLVGKSATKVILWVFSGHEMDDE